MNYIFQLMKTKLWVSYGGACLQTLQTQKSGNNYNRRAYNPPLFLGADGVRNASPTNLDANTLTTAGSYTLSSPSPNIPERALCILVVKPLNSSDELANTEVSQTLYYRTSGQIYHRTLHAGSWSDWARVDNFGCSTLAALASGLGALTNNGYIEQNEDLNNANTGWYYYSSAALNKPTTNSGILITIITTNNQKVQLAFAGELMYFRTLTSSTWGSWKSVSTT